ncbi:MAG: hypothetical protein CUN49_10145 [Candidatus Thermofonsia Clade 1 bacterium]|uniref:Response regulatory domain-containing protein n=1 Tax=Candidatus Thermofonsia Clade 1 bacterium TaxID=2364210 RepID=A0A2M8PD95_9CHLR|nr:MAG: hypothetical protein CUN49_10145 [Candidatus Thermofonsia Clade 1 bacterium]
MRLIRVLILDPEIRFAVPIKQALEGIGRYRVNVFASSPAALELLAREPQDFAVIDAEAERTGLVPLIETLQRLHPQLTIILSHRADQPPLSLPRRHKLLTLLKPYLARQLDALIRDSLSAAPTAPSAAQHTQALSQPDATFLRAIESLADGTTTLMLGDAPPGLPEPPISPEATLQHLISGTQSLAAAPQSAPVAPELSPQTLLAAEMALESATDDSVPLTDLADHLASEAEKVPPEARPPWIAPAESPNLEQTLSHTLHQTVQMATRPQLMPPERAAEPIAALALRFMQLTVDDAAKAAFLTRGAELIALASSGTLDELTRSFALREIARLWQGNLNAPIAFRPLQVNAETLYLLYSTRTVEDLTLSLLFPGDVPMRTIRRVARQLHEAMARLPKPEAPAAQPAEAAPTAEEVPEAAKTLPSRPTDLRPPKGLREAVAASAESAPPVVFTLALLPAEPPLADDLSALLPRYFEEAAAKAGWQVDGVEILPTHVSLQLSVPSEVAPAAAAERLMRETAERADKAALWLDACYIITPARSLTQRELAEFLEYARLVQSGMS